MLTHRAPCQHTHTHKDRHPLNSLIHSCVTPVAVADPEGHQAGHIHLECVDAAGVCRNVCRVAPRPTQHAPQPQAQEVCVKTVSCREDEAVTECVAAALTDAALSVHRGSGGQGQSQV